MTLAVALLERILRDVVIEGDCWVWQGATNDHGYGQIKVGGRKGKTLYVHRLMADAQPGDEVRHTCDTTRCVNPEHLLLGTHQENIQDMFDRERDGGFATQNRAKTHCPRGHEYAQRERRGKPERYCLVCKAEQSREYRRRKREQST